eukprot:Skav211977  [mRNA]  locus=scaffold1330:144095:150663:- [translate_table: standard]
MAGTGCPSWSARQTISRTDVQRSALSCANEDRKPAHDKDTPKAGPPTRSPMVARKPSCHSWVSGSKATPTAIGSTYNAVTNATEIPSALG